MYSANFYVYNALHGATLANCSHFQYVSGVKACIDVTLYDELFITPITEKHFLSPFQVFQDVLDSYIVIYSWITLVPVVELTRQMSS